MCHGFFIHSSPGGHRGCFQSLAIGEKGEGIQQKNPSKTEQKKDTESSVVIAREKGGKGEAEEGKVGAGKGDGKRPDSGVSA